jgi:Pyruvate/2-oxoacid:ferredoxin oxidoreductase delta subunit
MDAYEKLREKIDTSVPIPTPATDSKVEIEILKKLITPDEAEIASNLSPLPENADTIAQRAGMDVEQLKPVLETLARKGLIFKVYADDPLYNLVPMLPGIYEFQVGRLSIDMIELFEKYYAEKHGETVLSLKTPIARVIPVKESIPAELNILTYEEVENIIDEAGSVTLTDCLCRKNKTMIQEGCDGPADDICIVLGAWADYYAENGLGRKVTKEEGKNALKRAEDAGLIHNALNVREGSPFICNCCGCCCALIRGITQLKIPMAVAKSNFVAHISEDDCTGCGECVEVCHIKAIELKDSSVACLLEERCIGCGVCASHCPVDTIAMQRREKETVPPATMDDLMMKIAEERM